MITYESPLDISCLLRPSNDTQALFLASGETSICKKINMKATKQTQDVVQKLLYYWASVVDGGPTLKQQRANVVTVGEWFGRLYWKFVIRLDNTLHTEE